MEKHLIYIGKNTPPVQLLYINSPHQKDSWAGEVNIPLCKVNLFIKGHGYIIVNGKPYVASTGDVMIYRPQDIHYGNIPYEQTLEYFELLFEPEALKCLYGGEALIELFAYHHQEPRLDATHLTLTDERYNRLKNSFYRLLSCVRKDRRLNGLLAVSLLLEILCGIHDCSEQDIRPVNEHYPASLIRALDYIHLHLCEPLNNRIVSEESFVSTSYLNRLFRKHLGCPPHDYVLSCRLALARNLLSQGKSVTEACYSAGFQDSSSFGIIFKKHTGMLPSHYRKARGVAKSESDYWD